MALPGDHGVYVFSSSKVETESWRAWLLVCFCLLYSTLPIYLIIVLPPFSFLSFHMYGTVHTTARSSWPPRF